MLTTSLVHVLDQPACIKHSSKTKGLTQDQSSGITEVLSTISVSGGDGLVIQSCPTLCDPMDDSLPGFSVDETSQARILEWIAIPFSRDPSNQGIQSGSPALHVDSLQTELPGKWRCELQPARLLCSWGFPKKNTGMGIPKMYFPQFQFFPHFLILQMKSQTSSLSVL